MDCRRFDAGKIEVHDVNIDCDQFFRQCEEQMNQYRKTPEK